jgi:hypothetical protein
MTNVPTPTLTASGYSIPTADENLAGVVQDMQAAFGGGLNLSLGNSSSLTTPMGQLSSSLAAIKSDADAQFLGVVSAFDPQYATGRAQDAIGNIYMMSRIPAQGTEVTGACVGLAGTPIPAGVPVAVDGAGVLYTCAGGTIGTGGSLPMVFVSQASGPVAFTAPLAIYQTTPGWDAITGATQTQLGNLVENAQAFEARRQASVAVNAQGFAAAVRAAVFASGASLVPPQQPSSVYVYENPTAAAVVTGGITLPANSLYVAAAGGNPTAISKAILSKKNPGCNYAPSAIFAATCVGTALTVTALTSGVIAAGQTLITATGQPYLSSTGAAVTIASGSGTAWVLSAAPGSGNFSGSTVWAATTVQVPDSNYAPPQPVYNVSFTAAVVTPVNIQVTLAQVTNPPSNALSLLQASTGLITAFTGADGGAPVAQIGATVYGSRFNSTIQALLPTGVVILGVQVSTGSSWANSQAMQINQVPALGTITLVLA